MKIPAGLKDRIESSALSPDEIPTLSSAKVIIEKGFDEKSLIASRIGEDKARNEMTHVFFTATMRCNCACSYCFVDQPADDEPQDFRWLAPFVEKLLADNGSRALLLDFFGGEPFLKWKEAKAAMDELIGFGSAKDIAIKFRFYTNGTVIPDDALRYLAANNKNIEDLQITVDGPEKIHDQRRPLKIKDSAYRSIINNIGKLHANGAPVKIRVNIDNENIDAMPTLLDELQKHPWHRDIPIFFYCVQDLGEGCRGYEPILDQAKISEELPKLWRLAIERGFKISLKPSVKFIYCSSFNANSLVVDFSGKLYKCAILQDQAHAFGKVSSGGEIEISDKSALDNWMARSSLDIPACRDCKFMPGCASGCGGSAVNRFGTHNTNNCAGNQKLFIERLKLYVEQKYSI